MCLACNLACTYEFLRPPHAHDLSADQLVPASLCPDKAEGCEPNGAGASHALQVLVDSSPSKPCVAPHTNTTRASSLPLLNIFLPSVYVYASLLSIAISFFKYLFIQPLPRRAPR